MSDDTSRRVILRSDDAGKFVPYDRYGEPIPGLSWINISHDPETGRGSYFLRMEPDCSSLRHEHVDYEDFLVSFRPGTVHSSTTQTGCTLAVFLRTGNRLVT